MKRRLMLSAALAVAATPSLFAQTWINPNTGLWNDGANWTGGVPASSTSTVLNFNATGIESYTATHNLGAFTLNAMNFNNTGTGLITIGGSVGNTIAFGGAGAQVNVTSGTVLFNSLFTGAGTFSKEGAGTFIHDSSNAAFTGTLIVNNGTFVNRATTNAVTNFNPVAIVVNNGGTYQFGAALVGDPNLPNSTFITVNTGGTVNWQEGEVFGGLNLQGGVVNLQNGAMTGNGAVARTWTAGTLQGGNFTYSTPGPINKTTAGTVTIDGGTSVIGAGAVNIQEGTWSIVNAANLGVTPMTIGDVATTGTFQYQGGTASRAGNFTFNGLGGNIEVSNANTVLNLSGALGGTAGFNKTGAGTLALTGTPGHSGLTTVSQGTLLVIPGTTASGNIAVDNGATFAVNSGAGTSTFTAPQLNLGTTGSTVRFDLTTSASPATPLLTLTTGLDVSTGTHTLQFTNTQPFANGSFTAIDYTGAAVSSGFNLALPGRTAGNINYDTVNTQIIVNITGNDSVRWRGDVNNTWDVGTAPNVGGTNNWRLLSNNAVTNFIQTDTATFDDTATTFNPVLNVSAQPGALVVNNSANAYSITGSGSIDGTGTLTKQGTNTLTLATNNTYTGPTSIQGGTVQLGNGGTSGSIASPVTMETGTILAFNRSDAVANPNTITLNGNATISNVGAGDATQGGAVAAGANELTISGPGNIRFNAPLSGNGVLNKTGSGIATLAANNNVFTGTVNINGGTLLLNDFGGTGGDLSATAINVNNGGTFQFAVFPTTGNTDLPNTTYFNVATGGTVRWNESEDFGGINLQGGAVNMQGNTNYQGTTASEWQSGTISAVTGATPSIGGTGLINKLGGGTVTVTGVNLNNSGGLNVLEGTLSTDSPITNSGGMIVGGASSPATLQLRYNTSVNSTKNITLGSFGGTLDMSDAAGTLNAGGLITGTGSLTKAGPGTLNITGTTNDYFGGTIVNGGKLLVNNASGNALGDSSTTVVVNAGGSLGGSGFIANSVTINGDLSPGNSAGTLTIQSFVDFNAGSTFTVELAGTAVNEYDVLATSGFGFVDITDSSLVGIRLNGFQAPALSAFKIISNDAGTLTGTFNGLGDGDLFSFDGQVFQIRYNVGTFTVDPILGIVVNSSGGSVVIAAVPEPTTIALFGLVGVGGAGWYLRKRRMAGKVASMRLKRQKR